MINKYLLEKKMSFVFSVAVFIFALLPLNLQAQELIDLIIEAFRETEIARAKIYLNSTPVTVTDAHCERSAGGLHDFYSEGDYWWPNPENPGGAYQQRDGQTNPNNFTSHRHAMIRLSEITATLTSAWLLTNENVYADKVLEHLNAWFVDTKTNMNPNMLYAQAISGKVTGRSIGLIDAYHFVEVTRSVKVLSDKGGISPEQSDKIKTWFSEFLTWMTTHEYGILEMNSKNNHGTSWAATAASMALNLDSTFFVSRAAIPFLKKGENATIINYTSNAGWNAGGPGAGIYGTSKAAVHAITRALAKDLAEYGIRVNAVSPGTIDTPFHAQIKSTKPEVFASWKNNIMLGRLGRPEEVAAVVSFLASDDASFMTAETVQIGGGQALGI